MTEPVSGLEALEKATAKLPVARYVWGVVAVIAVVAFASFTRIGYGNAVLGGLIAFAGMVMFLIFQVADKISHEHLQTPARILIYFVLAFFMVVAVLLLTSSIGNWPWPLKDIIFPQVPVTNAEPISESSKSITEQEKQADTTPMEQKNPDSALKLEQLPFEGEPYKPDDGTINVEKKPDPTDPKTWMPTNNDNKTTPQFQQ